MLTYWFGVLCRVMFVAHVPIMMTPFALCSIGIFGLFPPALAAGLYTAVLAKFYIDLCKKYMHFDECESAMQNSFAYDLPYTPDLNETQIELLRQILMKLDALSRATSTWERQLTRSDITALLNTDPTIRTKLERHADIPKYLKGA